MNLHPHHLAAIAREFQVLNYIEAGLWIMLGLSSALQAFRFAGAARRDLVILGLALVAFGVSDVVEARTGAWWRPPWLLAWKLGCVSVMFALLFAYLRRRMR